MDNLLLCFQDFPVQTNDADCGVFICLVNGNI